jgi:4-hydroxy-tetrahydrodipicolinate reductase
MGKRLIQLIADDPELTLAAAVARQSNPQLGQDACALAGATPAGVVLSASLPADAVVDVVIDFSVPEAAIAVAEHCGARQLPLVVGTTGFSPAERRGLEALATKIPILIAPNMSMAVNLLMKLVGVAAQTFGAAADIAILERHHRTKKDAPSGTALRLAEVARQAKSAGRVSADAAGDPNNHELVEIPVHALRIADSPGEHTVVFGLMGETVELSHRALNRDGFVRGALSAAKFLAGKPPGLYTMDDVVGC